MLLRHLRRRDPAVRAAVSDRAEESTCATFAGSPARYGGGMPTTSMSLRELMLRRRPGERQSSGASEPQAEFRHLPADHVRGWRDDRCGIFFVQAVQKAGPGGRCSFINRRHRLGSRLICAELLPICRLPGPAYSYAYDAGRERSRGGGRNTTQIGVATAAVMVGWSGYVNKLLSNLFSFRCARIVGGAMVSPGSG